MSDTTRMIQFIDSEYRELFKIPDGASIRITYPPGDWRGTAVRECRHLDSHHFSIKGGDTYHIAQFAEIMERLGARYEPEVQLRGAEVVPFTAGEEKYLTYNREAGNTCVGHLSGDFGRSGDRFFSNWYNHSTKAEADWNGVAPEFQAELHSAVYALRQSLLKDYAAMSAFCQAHPEAKLPDRADLKHYGFKLDTEERRYYVLCVDDNRDSRFIIYAYDKDAAMLAADRPAYGTVLPGTADDHDMFFRNDKPDSNAIGYLRGDYGGNGGEFHHSWFGQDDGRNTAEFKAEFQTVIDALQNDVLKDHKSSTAYCYSNPAAKLPDRDGVYYGFKVETENRRYFVRCTTLKQDYFYVFAYDKAAPERVTERSAAEKPSVLKQIRDAEKAPRPPRKPKTPKKQKDGAEL